MTEFANPTGHARAVVPVREEAAGASGVQKLRSVTRKVPISRLNRINAPDEVQSKWRTSAGSGAVRPVAVGLGGQRPAAGASISLHEPER